MEQRQQLFRDRFGAALSRAAAQREEHERVSTEQYRALLGELGVGAGSSWRATRQQLEESYSADARYSELPDARREELFRAYVAELKVRGSQGAQKTTQGAQHKGLAD